MPRSPLLCALSLLAAIASQCCGADSEQSIPIYCQNVQPGTHYASQLTADPGQEVAANEYILTFDQAGAAISTTTGTVIASTTATPAVSVLSPCETVYDYPADVAVIAMQVSGIAMPEIVIVAGSSAGVGPYGVVDCALSWYGDPNEAGVSDTFFWTANQPTLEAGTPVLSAVTTTPNGTAVAGTVGAAFSYQISATNSPTFYSGIGLSPPSLSMPAGLSLDTATGLISGTPSAAGSFVLNLVAGNAVWSGSEELTLNIAPAAGAPQISSALSATATVGTAFSYQITASHAPTSYSATGLPAGLACNATSGLISGTPTVPGSSEAQINAIDGSGSSAQMLDIAVSPAAAAPAITNAITASGTVGTAFSLQLAATNTPTSFGLGVVYNDLPLGEAELPPGLSFSASTGLISGTPTASGIYPVATYAANGAGLGAILTIGITIAPSAPPVISSATSATGTVGIGFIYQITASNAPTSYQASDLPPGLSVSTTTGAITGTPTAAGTYVMVVEATCAGGTGVSLVTVSVDTNNSVTIPAISSSLSVTSQTGTAFDYAIAASNSPTAYGASFLPVGLSIDSATGVISGTPAVGGTCLATISATNAGGTASEVLTITIAGSTTTATGTTATGTTATGTGTATSTTGSTTSAGASSGSSSGGCGLGSSGMALLISGLVCLRRQRPRQRTAHNTSHT